MASVDSSVEVVSTKEAKEILSRPFGMKNVPQDVLDAHRMAIKALEQEPCEDCVSRTGLIDKLEILDKRYGSDFYWEVRKMVDSLPPVTPTRNKGKWIAIDDTHSQCEKCKAIFCISSSNEWEVNYCPNCGAEMEVEE